MQARRALLGATLTGVAGAAVLTTLFGRPRTGAAAPGRSEVERPDAEWRRLLTPEQYRVLRGHGTERAGSSPLDREKRRGTFACAGCGAPLFASEAKCDSGTGWPSFSATRSASPRTAASS